LRQILVENGITTVAKLERSLESMVAHDDITQAQADSYLKHIITFKELSHTWEQSGKHEASEEASIPEAAEASKTPKPKKKTASKPKTSKPKKTTKKPKKPGKVSAKSKKSSDS
jgi:hypothetical protein